MSSSSDVPKDSRADGLPKSDSDMAQISKALTELAKGEKTAEMLESQLSSLEKNLDDLLASFDQSEGKEILARLQEQDSKQPKAEDSEADTKTTVAKDDKLA